MKNNYILIVLVFTILTNIINYKSFSQTPVYQSSINHNLSSPIRLAIDVNDNIYVTDGYQKCVLKFNSLGNFIETFYIGNNPISIAINNNNEIFVGDGTDGTITKILPNGTQSIFCNGLGLPNSLTFGTDGLLYVSDGILQRVNVYDISGNLVRTIGLGNLIFPTTVVFDKTKNHILVSEQGGVGSQMNPICKIWEFEVTGNLVGSFASNGNGDGKFYRIQGMAIGKCGNLYVCDPFQGNITIFNPNHTFLSKFGQFGNQTGQLCIPIDICFGSQEQIIVASMNNGNLQIYAINDTLPTSQIINSDANICSGQIANIKINFTGTSPWTFTYTINGLQPTTLTTSSNPYILQATQGGIYEITALSDLNLQGNCFSGSANINVSNTTPTATLTTGNDVICEGTTYNIPVNFTGNSPWTFTYTQNGINPVTIATANNPHFINTSESGLYELTSITSGGCPGNILPGNANLTSASTPIASFVTENQYSTICEGENEIFPIELIGNPPFTLIYSINNNSPFSLYTNDNTLNITANTSGNYNLLSVNNSLCPGRIINSSAYLSVNPLPTLTMTSVNTSICQGTTTQIPLTITGNPPFDFDYNVNNNSYSVSTNENQLLLQVNDSGTYEIPYITANGCTSTNITGISHISYYEIPTAQFTFGNNQVSICEGQSATLPIVFTGESPWSFIYSLNNNNIDTITCFNNTYNLNVSGGGIYELQWVSDAHCYNYSTLGTPEVVVTPLPESIMNSPTVTSCSGKLANIPITFNGVGPWTFIYTIDGNNPTSITTSENPYYLAVNIPGNYQISGISSGNCVGSNMFGNTQLQTAENPIPIFTYSNNGFEFTFINNSQFANTYYWNFGDGFSSNDVNPTHLYVSPTTFDVSLTASNGLCPDSVTTQSLDLTILSLLNKISENDVLVYPNPCVESTNIAFKNNINDKWTLELINSIGQSVYLNTFSQSKVNINLNNLQSGIYTAVINAGNIKKIVKLIVK